jgi:predicted exporter
LLLLKAKQAQLQHEQDMQNENYQNERDRINKKEIALIAAESKAELADRNVNEVPDVLEISRISNEQSKLEKDHSLKMADIQSKMAQNSQKLQIEREKLQVDRENQKNDLEIAKINARNRASKKPK